MHTVTSYVAMTEPKDPKALPSKEQSEITLTPQMIFWIVVGSFSAWFVLISMSCFLIVRFRARQERIEAEKSQSLRQHGAVPEKDKTGNPETIKESFNGSKV